MFEGCFDIFDIPSDNDEKISASKSKASPNPANADETNPPTDSNIEALPEEILAQIFTKILPPYRNDLREICRSWKNIIDTLVGTTIRIGTLSEFDPEYEFSSDLIPKYHSPNILAKVGIDHLLVGNLSESWEAGDSWGEWFSYIWKCLRFTETAPPTPIPPLKNAGLVSLLSIFGKLCPSHFSQFLLQLPTIRIFSITFYTLGNLEATQLVTLSQSLPHLEVLVIRGGLTTKRQHPRQIAQFIDQLTTGWNLDKILQNSLAIIANHFPKLEYASFQLIYGIQEGLSITKALLQCLTSHSGTIKSFAVEYVILLDDEFIGNEHAPENHPELISLTRSLQSEGLPQLKGLRILPVILPKLPFSAAWSVLTKEQKELKDFAVMGVCYKLEFLSAFVTANFRSLTCLFIWEVKLFDDASRSARQLDLAMFSECDNLRKLALRGWTVSLSVRNVVNADQLPKSLRHLDLRDMAICTDDVRCLGLELPLLKTLELHFIGDKREMGMDLLTLREIISLRRMKEVKIFRSLNGKLYSDGIFNGDPADPEQILEMPGGMIAFHIGQSGYYVNTPCSRFDEEM